MTYIRSTRFLSTAEPIMRASDESLIRGFPIFRNVSNAAFEQLAGISTLSDFDPGRVLLREGERPSHLFVLLNGVVETYSEHAGKRTSLSFIRPPSAFIVAAVWLDQVQLTSARVLLRSRILAIPAPAVRTTITEDHSFSLAAGVELAIRYRDVMKELKNQRMRDASDRLANWLLTECQALGGAPEFRIEIGKSALAARLGITGEHLSRSFAQLRMHGVETDGQDVRIDLDALAAFARPDPLIDGADV